MSKKEIEPAARFAQTLDAAIRLPGVRIDRESFLRSALGRHCSDEQLEQAVATTPAAAGVPLSVVDAAANVSIRYETGKAAALSAAAGLPGGLMMAATVPADLAQYFGHVLRVAQKLAYLYSWPDLGVGDGSGGLDEETESLLTLFVGVMFGVSAAQSGVAKVAEMMAQQVVKKVPQKALMKGTIYPVVKKVTIALGGNTTKKIFANGLAKAVPVAGAAISGGLTFGTFRPMAKRLQKHLATLVETKPGLGPASVQVEVESVTIDAKE